MSDYFKASELVKRLKVSERTIYRWVEEAKQGDLNLVLLDRGEKKYIAKSDSNLTILDGLAKERIKYKNRKSLKQISPDENFYKVFTDNHIYDIIKNIEINKEVPLKYSYMNGGAQAWDKHAHYMWSSKDESVIPKTKELTRFIIEYLISIISKYKKVNIIDIGPGNGLPVKSILSKLVEADKLNKYIALDISPDMLNILEKNITNWYNGKVNFEGIIGDITKDTFQSTAFRNIAYEGEDVSIINIVLYIGGTIENDSYSQQIRIINSSMSSNDLFVLEQGVDNGVRNLRFRFGEETQSQTSDLAQRKMVIDLLNIDESLYEVERFYSEKDKAKIINIRFKYDIVVNIDSGTLKRKISFFKGDSLTIWRYNCHTTIEVLEELDKNGFRLLSATTSMNKESGIFISEIKKKP